MTQLTEERGLDEAEEEPQRHHARIILHRAGAGAHDGPAAHDSWQEARRPDLVQDHVGRDLRQDVANEEDADNRVVLRPLKPDILLKIPETRGCDV